MSAPDARERWEHFWARTDAHAKAQKASPTAVFDLSRYYGSLSSSDKQTINGVLAEWVLSDDESKRFDALALIDEHRIASARRSLEELATKLDISRDPGAPYERAKVDRILARLV